MDIIVTFNNGCWVTDPSPAIVAVGTRLRWILRAPELQMRLLLWRVHFKDRLPFGEDYKTLEVKTQFTDARQRQALNLEILQSLGLSEDVGVSHRGVTHYQEAKKPGEYKYDLSVQDAISGERIGDDDPYLYVLNGILSPDDVVGF